MTTKRAVELEKLNIGVKDLKLLDYQRVGKGENRLLVLQYEAINEQHIKHIKQMMRSTQIRYAVYHGDKDYAIVSGILSSKVEEI